jgi:hypothetical protein
MRIRISNWFQVDQETAFEKIQQYLRGFRTSKSVNDSTTKERASDSSLIT